DAPDPTDTSTLSLHDALPICSRAGPADRRQPEPGGGEAERHGSALRRPSLVCNGEHATGGTSGCGGGERAAASAVIAKVLTREGDRKSTRLNSSHVKISYAVF